MSIVSDEERFAATILLIDDERDITEVLAMMLRTGGYKNVHIVNDPRRAVETFRTIRPDLVITDLAMPGMDGFDVVQALRAEATTYVPIIMMTAYADRDNRLNALRLGVQDFISKPFEPAELYARIRNLLDVRLLYRRLEETNRLLEERVRERTQELELLNEQLRRSNEELSTFAYVAAHDLKEPVRMVVLNAQLLIRSLEGRLGERERRIAEFIIEGGRRINDLIDRLLEYSRVDTRGNPFETVDLNEVLSDVLQDLALLLEEHQVEVTADPLPVVWGDRVQLRQVLQNLITNAVKFRDPDRRPRVHLSAREEKDEFVITVQDNGIGIEPEYQERIFLIFQRLHDREKYPGLGAGLAICKRIVERHRGRIWVESEPGKGSTFYIALPKEPVLPGPSKQEE
ncbi:MAG: hypothetical protein KatS3mg115_0803 [Candidatus Poribacteria bacterium]|nr:MAG: hypothetical protein KatS3mg115_0803 [Candidatus Poribacteria bacterium]